MSQLIVHFLDRAFAVACALSMAQLPLFMQQYQMQLYGHIAELNIQVEGIRQAAAATGKTIPEFIGRFTTSGDVDFTSQGALMNNMLERTLTLSEASQALSVASVLEKPFLFFKYVDWEIAYRTLENFQAGISLTLEGAVYGVLGIFFGYTLFGIIKKLLLLASKAAQAYAR